MYCMSFICCACSPVMVSFCWRMLIHVLTMLVRQNKRQKMLRWSPMSQMCLSQRMMSSYAERSEAQRKLSPRNSMAFGTKLNNAIQIGICISIGKHPPIGLTPYWLYSCMISCCFFMASSCLGYLALISSIFGRSTRILADER